MMRRVIFCLLACLPLTMIAQEYLPTDSSSVGSVAPADTATPATENPTDSIAPVFRFGFLSYDTVMKGMVEYADAQDSITQVREAYEKELQRVEKEFNKKYESFLEGQREFPRTILLKRQNELQDLMQQNIDFKAQARLDLQAAEERFMAPVRQRLNEVLAVIAKEYGLAFVLNTDANACPFIDPFYGMDIQAIAEEYLK